MQTQTHEGKMNVDIIKRIISLWNQDWRTVTSETEKLNDLLRNIPTNDITELTDLIYGGAKVICEKIRVTLKTTDRKSKPGCELRQD